MLEFFADIDWSDVTQAGIDTLIMLGWSLGFTVLFGLPLGIVLYLTGQPQLLHARGCIACCRFASTSCVRCRSLFC